MWEWHYSNGTVNLKSATVVNNMLLLMPPAAARGLILSEAGP